MATLTMAQTYAYARQAGFDPAAAVIVSAIAAGESGLNPAAVNKRAEVTEKWGPPVGLLQVRTLKADTGTGRLRDITRLADPVQNMAAAYEISGHGKDFTPWEAYTNGSYRQFLGQASTAAHDGGGYIPGATVQPVGLLDGGLPDVGANLQRLAVLGVLVVLGGGLVVVGAARATGAGSVIGRAARTAVKVAAVA